MAVLPNVSPTNDLLSLFGKEQLLDIQNRLSKTTGLGFITVDYKGDPLTDYTGFCDFCHHFRDDPELSKNCIASDAMSSIRSAISGEPLIYRCPCGLMEIAIPIVVGGVYLGGFLGGQARCNDTPDDILQMTPATEPAVFQEALAAASKDLEKQPVFPYQHYCDLAELVELVITLLSENKIHQMEREQSLTQELRKSSFLEKEFLGLLPLLRGSDYRDLLRCASGLIDRLFRGFPDPAARVALLEQIASRMDLETRTGDEPDSLSLFPLPGNAAEHVESSVLWLRQILDYHFRKSAEQEHAVLGPVFEVINQNLGGELSLGMLVRCCNLSQSYLSRLFRTHFGLSVTDYIHLRKLEQGKRLLAQRNQSAEDLAYELGYNEVTYFSKVFKKYEGITLQDYKATKFPEYRKNTSKTPSSK